MRLRYRPDRLELELRGAPETALVAARERVGAHGGSLTLQAPGVVRARLPVVAHA